MYPLLCDCPCIRLRGMVQSVSSSELTNLCRPLHILFFDVGEMATSGLARGTQEGVRLPLRSSLFSLGSYCWRSTTLAAPNRARNLGDLASGVYVGLQTPGSFFSLVFKQECSPRRSRLRPILCNINTLWSYLNTVIRNALVYLRKEMYSPPESVT